MKGIFLPLVTPFKDGKLDTNSYKNMIEHYGNFNISGLIPLGTTGESPTISDYEYQQIVEMTIEYNNKRKPIYVGLGGNDTSKTVKQLKILEKSNIDGILSVSPYYNRPDQRGIYEHFSRISDSTDMSIILYNIPYRTGRNIENQTIYKLAEKKNIVAVKDASGDFKQSTDLILNKPEGFSVLTGEDSLFYSTLAIGGDGGILASANVNTQDFIDIFDFMQDNNYLAALTIWRKIHPLIPMLFEEPNPSPIKYVLKQLGLIESDEVRLPLMEITDELKSKIEGMITKMTV